MSALPESRPAAWLRADSSLWNLEQPRAKRKSRSGTQGSRGSRAATVDSGISFGGLLADLREGSHSLHQVPGRATRRNREVERHSTAHGRPPRQPAAEGTVTTGSSMTPGRAGADLTLDVCLVPACNGIVSLGGSGVSTNATLQPRPGAGKRSEVTFLDSGTLPPAPASHRIPVPMHLIPATRG